MFDSHTQPSQPLLRREDARLLTGAGQFVGNVAAAHALNTLHAVFVRSPYAKATVLSINAEYAQSLPNVVAVLSADDVAHLPNPQVNTHLGDIAVAKTALMGSDVACIGAPVALVLARSRDAAQAAADAIMMDFDSHDGMIDFALEAPVLARTSNAQGESPVNKATVTVSIALPRVAASPLEPRAALMVWD